MRQKKRVYHVIGRGPRLQNTIDVCSWRLTHSKHILSRSNNSTYLLHNTVTVYTSHAYMRVCMLEVHTRREMGIIQDAYNRHFTISFLLLVSYMLHTVFSSWPSYRTSIGVQTVYLSPRCFPSFCSILDIIVLLPFYGSIRSRLGKLLTTNGLVDLAG